MIGLNLYTPSRMESSPASGPRWGQCYRSRRSRFPHVPVIVSDVLLVLMDKTPRTAVGLIDLYLKSMAAICRLIPKRLRAWCRGQSLARC
jgi:hypothetical protein